MPTLAGISVLITRPTEMAEPWLKGFASEGAEVFHQPGLELQPTPDSEPSLRHLNPLRPGTVVVYTSAAAVSAALARQPKLLNCRSWAVGRQTARSLIAGGCRKVFTPAEGVGTDALLADPRFPGGSPILINCARGGRKALARALSEAGHQCQSIYVYRRRPAALRDQLVPALKGCGDRLVVIATSVAVLERVHDLLGSELPLTSCPLVVVSDRIGRRARKLGFDHVVVSELPGLDSVITATQVAAGYLPN